MKRVRRTRIAAKGGALEKKARGRGKNRVVSSGDAFRKKLDVELGTHSREREVLEMGERMVGNKGHRKEGEDPFMHVHRKKEKGTRLFPAGKRMLASPEEKEGQQTGQQGKIPGSEGPQTVGRNKYSVVEEVKSHEKPGGDVPKKKLN